MKPENNTDKPQADHVTIHNHKCSGMWVVGLAFAFLGALVTEGFVNAWERDELEKIRAQQRIQIVKDAGNISN